MQGVAGPITAVLVLHFFDPRIQGYYYTFGSLLALQIFVELGLTTVITTFVAHEWASLSMDVKGGISGDPVAIRRLAAIARYAVRWYLLGAVALLILLLAVGGWFFRAKSDVSSVDWMLPWFAICFVAAASFALTPAWAILTGCGQISRINSYKLFESVLRSLVMWVAIVLGATLWAVSFSAAAALLAGIVFVLIRYRVFFAALSNAEKFDGWVWRKEIGPLQLKVGLTWLCGYFAFSMFTPVAFYFLGPASAGQVGMTWAFVGGLSGLASTLVQIRSPQFACLVAQRKFSELDEMAKKTAWFGPGICVLGGLAGIAILVALNVYRPELALRFLPIGAIILFMLAETLHQASMVQSTYLRAFKQEPFFGLSWATAGIIGLGTILLTSRLEGYGGALSYLAGTAFALAWGSIIFTRRRKEWTFPR